MHLDACDGMQRKPGVSYYTVMTIALLQALHNFLCAVRAVVVHNDNLECKVAGEQHLC